VNEEKQALRELVRRETAGMTEEAVRASDAAIVQRLFNSAVYERASRVFCYYSRGREVSTHALIADAAARGKTVALPVSAKGGEMRVFSYTGAMRPGLYGIMEPEGGEILTPEQNDLIIVPALCYDRTGHRLGQGGGYYDRYLAKQAGITVGLCRDRQLRERLPREWNDFPVEYVLTETAMLHIKCGTSEEVPPRVD